MYDNTINNIRLYRFDSIASTNREALDADYVNHMSVILADKQTGGRGRLGRSFHSPSGGLYMSVVLDPENIPCGVGLCTAAAALAAKSALENEGIKGIGVKWVNDLLINGKKVAGILTEAKSESGKISRIVVGIGINLAEPEGGFPDDIKDRAAAVNYTGEKSNLAASIAAQLEKYIKMSKSELSKLYSSNLSMLGKRVTATDYADGQKQFIGTVLGADEDCKLILALENGELRKLSSGEIC